MGTWKERRENVPKYVSVFASMTLLVSVTGCWQIAALDIAGGVVVEGVTALADKTGLFKDDTPKNGHRTATNRDGSDLYQL